MSGLKFYYDLMSQPSRALFIFLKVNDIPFDDKPVALRNGKGLPFSFGHVSFEN